MDVLFFYLLHLVFNLLYLVPKCHLYDTNEPKYEILALQVFGSGYFGISGGVDLVFIYMQKLLMRYKINFIIIKMFTLLKFYHISLYLQTIKCIHDKYAKLNNTNNFDLQVEFHHRQFHLKREPKDGSTQRLLSNRRQQRAYRKTIGTKQGTIPTNSVCNLFSSNTFFH